MERLPKIGDVTEFGTVKSVENIDGIAIVVMRDKCGLYGFLMNGLQIYLMITENLNHTGQIFKI